GDKGMRDLPVAVTREPEGQLDPVGRERDGYEDSEWNARADAFDEECDRRVPGVHLALPPQKVVQRHQSQPRYDEADADGEQPHRAAPGWFNTAARVGSVSARTRRRVSRWPAALHRSFRRD